MLVVVSRVTGQRLYCRSSPQRLQQGAYTSARSRNKKRAVLAGGLVFDFSYPIRERGAPALRSLQGWEPRTNVLIWGRCNPLKSVMPTLSQKRSERMGHPRWLWCTRSQRPGHPPFTVWRLERTMSEMAIFRQLGSDARANSQGVQMVVEAMCAHRPRRPRGKKKERNLIEDCPSM